MNNYMNKNKHLLIVLAPLILGWLLNTLIIYLPFFGSISMWILNLAFVLFWFWGGRQFAKLSIKKVYSYLLGNVVWLVSFLLFIWQFIFVDEAFRNIALAGLSQYYVLFTLIIGTQIHLSYSTQINTTDVVIISYIVMLVVFTLGFIYQAVRGKKSS